MTWKKALGWTARVLLVAVAVWLLWSSDRRWLSWEATPVIALFVSLGIVFNLTNKIVRRVLLAMIAVVAVVLMVWKYRDDATFANGLVLTALITFSEYVTLTVPTRSKAEVRKSIIQLSIIVGVAAAFLFVVWLVYR